MKVCITSGECLNEIMSKRYQNETFIPFNEAMITGSYTHILFSEEFMIERANTHNVTISEYKSKLNGFLNLLNNINKYDDIYMYFGNEPFCLANIKVVLQTLKEYSYKGNIILFTVDEITGDVLEQEQIIL